MKFLITALSVLFSLNCLSAISSCPLLKHPFPLQMSKPNQPDSAYGISQLYFTKFDHIPKFSSTCYSAPGAAIRYFLQFGSVFQLPDLNSSDRPGQPKNVVFTGVILRFADQHLSGSEGEYGGLSNIRVASTRKVIGKVIYYTSKLVYLDSVFQTDLTMTDSKITSLRLSYVDAFLKDSSGQPLRDTLCVLDSGI